MPTLTPNYSWNLPLVADPIDADLWGTQLNANFSAQDTTVKAISNVANAAAVSSFGDLKPTAASSAPSLWVLCYGQAISRATYSGLFGAIGTTWGVGDGTTTFNVPDLRGRALIGKDDMGGSSANRITVAGCGMDGDVLGTVGGSEFLHQHTHTLTDGGHSHSIQTGSGTFGAPVQRAAPANNATVSGTVSTESSTTGITIANAGTGSSQNVQPSAVVNWLIYTGV